MTRGRVACVDVLREWERGAHLEQIALGGESVLAGAVVVVRPGLHGPEVHGGTGRRLGHRAPDEGGLQPRFAAPLTGSGIDDHVEEGGAVLGA